jgi:hypothetical protein
MLGGWSGTLNVASVQVDTGVGAPNTCNEAWTIAAQNGERFSGSFQLTGGTTGTCAQSGDVNGVVSTSGRISGLAHSVTLGALPGCTRVAGDGTMEGVVTNPSSLSAESRDRVRCPTGSATTDSDRSITLLMTRR